MADDFKHFNFDFVRRHGRVSHHFVEIQLDRIRARALEPLRKLLLDDMEALGLSPGPDPDIEVPVPTDDAGRLGWAYVVAGSSVGARYLARQAERLRQGTADGAGFLHHFARSPLWADVLTQLAAARLDTQQADRCRAAALSAFATAEAAFLRAGDEQTR